jgi:hypothetical protein
LAEIGHDDRTLEKMPNMGCVRAVMPLKKEQEDNRGNFIGLLRGIKGLDDGV